MSHIGKLLLLALLLTFLQDTLCDLFSIRSAGRLRIEEAIISDTLSISYSLFDLFGCERKNTSYAHSLARSKKTLSYFLASTLQCQRRCGPCGTEGSGAKRPPR